MLSNELSNEEKEAIIRACKEHEDQEGSQKNFRRCIVFEGFFVKFDDYSSLLPQYETQKYISELADRDRNAPHIPKVYHFFYDKNMAYLVMEYIELTSTPVLDLPQRVAQALQWLYDLPAPNNATIGPLGGGRARHLLFQNCTAPIIFSDITVLEKYLNKALERSFPFLEPRLSAIHISHEPLVFTQSDMDRSNFGIDKYGNTCLFDFRNVGLLPQSFASFTMSATRPEFVTEVAKYLKWERSSNLTSMGGIRGTLWTLADATLGFK